MELKEIEEERKNHDLKGRETSTMKESTHKVLKKGKDRKL